MKTRKILFFMVMFLFLLALIMVMPNNVFAEETMSEEFKQILNEEGKLVITDTSLSEDRAIFLQESISKYNTDDCWFTISALSDNIHYGILLDNAGTVEYHEVEVVFEEKISDEFKSILTDGKLQVPSSAKEDVKNILFDYLPSVSTPNFIFELICICDENGIEHVLMDENCTKATIRMMNENYKTLEQHVVDLTYMTEPSEEFKSILKNGKFLVPTSTKSGVEEVISNYLISLSQSNLNFRIYNLDENYTKATIKMLNASEQLLEQHEVELIYLTEPSDDFKSILENGKFLVPSSTKSGVEEIISSYLYNISLSNNNYMFQMDNYNESYTKATMKMLNKTNQLIEQHEIELTYLTEQSENFKKYLNKDGKLEINSIKPSDEMEYYTLFELLIWKPDVEMRSWNLSEDFSSCNFTVNDETHIVDIVYNYDNAIKEKLQGFVNNFPEDISFFKVQDMELINYWVNNANNEETDTFADYSGELKAYLNNYNVKLVVDSRAGGGNFFQTARIGIAVMTYDDVAYYINGTLGAKGEHIIYVPDTTGNSVEELRDAAQKRINEYLGKEDIATVSYAGKAYDLWLNVEYEAKKYIWEQVNPNMTFEEFKSKANDFVDSYDDFGEVIGLNGVTENDDTFIVTVKTGDNKGKDYNIIIRKDSSKMITPSYKTADISTNIEISSSSTSIPLDTSIQAKQLTSGEEYEKIIKLLDVEENVMYDLKLYSDSLNDYVTKLENGTFEVKIPIPDNLKDKELIAYYADSEGNVEEINVEVIDGYATFNTKHFSIYTLAAVKTSENNKEEKPVDTNKPEDNKSENTNSDSSNPKTGDNILLFVGILFIAVIGIITTTILKKHNKTKK